MADRRQDRVRKDTEASMDPLAACLDCLSDDPQRRSAHQLFIARQGTEALERHLWQFYGVHLEERERRTGYIRGIMQWAQTVMDTYRDIVDEETGAVLSWWVSRQRALEKDRKFVEDARQRCSQVHASQPVVEMPSITQSVVTGVQHAERVRMAEDDWPDDEGVYRCRQCGAVTEGYELCSDCSEE